jgi:hypothetical protein
MQNTYRNHPKNPANQPFNVTPKPGKNRKKAIKDIMGLTGDLTKPKKD